MKTVGLYEDLSFRFSKRDPADKEKYMVTIKAGMKPKQE
jgi:hypothetical protein